MGAGSLPSSSQSVFTVFSLTLSPEVLHLLPRMFPSYTLHSSLCLVSLSHPVPDPSPPPIPSTPPPSQNPSAALLLCRQPSSESPTCGIIASRTIASCLKLPLSRCVPSSVLAVGRPWPCVQLESAAAVVLHWKWVSESEIWKKGKDPHPQDKIQHLDFTKDPRPTYYKTPPCAFSHKNVRSKAVFGP